MKKYQKWIVILLVIFMTVCMFIILNLNKKEEKNNMEVTDTQKRESIVNQKEEPTKGMDTGSEDFAIFGVDTRSDNLKEGTRSDSLMIVHVDHTSKKIYVASVYRDCYVQIPDHGYDKITHAHSFGGPELALDTLNVNFDLNLKKYVTVNFSNVAELVDDLDGVEQEITSDEIRSINEYISEINEIRGTESEELTQAGTYNLDGTQAVAYSRIRYTTGGDYKRSERQRTILFKIFSKAKALDTTDALALVSKMLDKVHTNYSSNDIVELLYHLAEYEIVGMDAFPKTFYAGKMNGVWYEVPDTLTEMSKSLHQFIYPEELYEPSATVQEISNQIDTDRNTSSETLEQITFK